MTNYKEKLEAKRDLDAELYAQKQFFNLSPQDILPISIIEDNVEEAYQAGFDANKKLLLKAREALEEIAGQDFRGNRPHECVIAFNALAEFEAFLEGDK